VRTWLYLAVVGAGACGARDVGAFEIATHDAGTQLHDGEQTTTRDARVDDIPRQVPDARVDETSDTSALRKVLIEYLGQYDRWVNARCPCQVENGDFPSLKECVAKTGGGLGWAECAAVAVASDDSAVLRANLRCQTEESKLRNECLESASCDREVIAACAKDKLGCPQPSPHVLTRILYACPDAVLLAR
jgi:hypothetical protein